MIGFPSKDKPWLKFYGKEALEVPVPKCKMYDYLYENNKNDLSNTALLYFGGKVSFKALFKNIENAAKAFTKIGVKSGDIVTILTTNMPETVYVVYALNRIGAVASLEYVTMNDEDILRNMQSYGSKTVVVLNLLMDKFPKCLEAAENIIVLSAADSMPFLMKTAASRKMPKINDSRYTPYKTFIEQGKDTLAAYESYKEDKTAVLLHSGGTTGVPKSVELTDTNVNSIPHFYYYGFTGLFKREEIFMHCVPPFHAFGFSGIHMPLCLGMTMAACAKFDEEYVTKEFFKVKPHHFEAGPSQLSAIVDYGQKNGLSAPRLKTFGVGGAMVTNEVQEKANRYFADNSDNCELIVGYGMSEVCGAATTTRKSCPKQGSVGIPFAPMNVKVTDPDTGEELPYGNEGELCIASPALMKCYFKNEKETGIAVKEEDGIRWVHTGDIGRIDEDGCVYIVGRLKRIYATQTEEGLLYKLFPDYIEQTISSCVGVNECAVICVPHPKDKHIPLAFIVKEESSFVTDGLEEFMTKNLPPYCIPREITYLESIPHTTAGKIDYRSLEKLISE